MNPDCRDCRGTGKYVGLMVIEPCGRCGGNGREPITRDTPPMGHFVVPTSGRVRSGPATAFTVVPVLGPLGTGLPSNYPLVNVGGRYSLTLTTGDRFPNEGSGTLVEDYLPVPHDREELVSQIEEALSRRFPGGTGTVDVAWVTRHHDEYVFAVRPRPAASSIWALHNP